MVRVLGVIGGSGSGPGVPFFVGDAVTVQFTLEQGDGSPWGLGEMTFSSAMVSGPTFNYQRVIAEQNDVATRAVKNVDGSYSYTFSTGLPSTYLPPLNDSPAIGSVDGERAGQPLGAGTYTVGLGFAWSYTVDGTSYVDAGEDTFDFVFGVTSGLAPRQVVTRDNCNQCHVDLQAHGGLRREVDMCVLCHTAGAEDLNDPSIAGGTPGVSIDSRVLFHKIHNGRHLPSVLGVGVNANGTLRYDLPPKPYQVVAGDGTVVDYSGVGFPAFPSRAMPMPQDFGHAALSPAEQAVEDQVRSGITSCHVCHGDPDGSGPLEAPLNGDLIHAQPLRVSCGSCHDDVDYSQDYLVNLQTMQAQPTNGDCTLCHPADGSLLATRTGHQHPLDDPLVNSGLNFVIASVVESGVHNGDGTVDAGEGVQVTFNLQDDVGLALPATSADTIRAILSGPTSNAHVLLDVVVPPQALTGAQPFTLELPELVQLEFVGDSTAAGGEVFATTRFPHLDLTGAKTSVRVRTATGPATSTLAQRGDPGENFIELVNATGFDRDDYLVIDDGGAREEYLRVQHVEGNRVWFSSIFTPGYARSLRCGHSIGARVDEVTLAAKTAGSDYMLDPAGGTLTEMIEFGAGNAVLVDYSTPFLMPATYSGPPNDSPDLASESGEWVGQPLVDGTYTLNLTAHKAIQVNVFNELTPYEVVSPAAAADFLVGSAGTPEPYDLLSSVDNCKACHQDVWYHENRYRGFETCVACHGASGAEDRPTYVAAGAPATTGTSVSFRELLHGMHMGALIEDPQAFQLIGEGPAAYPNNFAVKTFESIHFPAMPGGPANCAACHGEANTAWLEPADRTHPAPITQLQPVKIWRASCVGCHNSQTSIAHMDVNTAVGGTESCSICHSPGEINAVDVMHRTK